MALRLVIVTPYGQVYDGLVESVVLPGSQGEFGVLEQHERFLSPLDCGAVRIRTGQGELYAAISPGFAEVGPESVTLMVESSEIASDIDTARAEQARDRAREGLAQLDSDADLERYREYEAAMNRAENRLRVGQGGPGAS